MSEFKHSLGSYVRDVISQVEGVIIGRTQWITGCNRYTIERPLDKEGELPELYTTDEHRIQVIDAKTEFTELAKKSEAAPPAERGDPPVSTPNRGG